MKRRTSRRRGNWRCCRGPQHLAPTVVVVKPWRFYQSRRGGKDSQERPYFRGNCKEARIEEAHVEAKKELEGGDVKEEACRSVAEWVERGKEKERSG